MMKRELKINPISECRWDERRKTKPEESTHLSDTVVSLKENVYSSKTVQD
jgi:hypothetical protein